MSTSLQSRGVGKAPNTQSGASTGSHGPTPSPEQLIDALRAGMRVHASKQSEDGSWAGDYGGPLFLLPGLLIAQSITGFRLTDYQRSRMRSYLEATQNQDGGWGLHIEDESTVFGTALNYVALRILGASAEDASSQKARARLRLLGGVEGIPTWGKFWLAVLGVYRWEGVAPLSPELWIMPRSMPVHPGRYWCHARAVFLPMSFFYGRRLSGPETPLVRELREELFVGDWSQIDWPSLRFRVAATDIYREPTQLLRTIQKGLSQYEALTDRFPKLTKVLRKRALREVEELMIREDQSTSYLTIGPISKAIHLLAAWFRDPDSEAYRAHVARIEDYLWDGVDGLKMQGYNGSQFWDTAFSALAALEGDLVHKYPEFRETLRRAYGFVDQSQVREDIEDWQRMWRSSTKGSWPFSTKEQAWTVSDCTAEGLKVALLAESLVEQPISHTRLREAVDFLLREQNPDGGWSEYEKRRAPKWIEELNAAEVFGDIMFGHSYVECTSACLQGLALFSQRDSKYERRKIVRALRAGGKFLRQAQKPDGSWYGGWGICFTYGTWFGVEGLASLRDTQDLPRLHRAVDFLLAKQRDDGGWGESYRSCVELRYVHQESQVVQSSWAMLALLAAQESFHTAGETRTDIEEAVRRGAALLLERQILERQLGEGEASQELAGAWPQEAISGVFNRNCMIHYDNYRMIFPIWALSRFQRSYR